MFAQRVRPDELIDLLAAESYDPVLMKYCGYTKTSPKLGDFITDKPRLGVTGTIANAYVPGEAASAVPYLTTKQVDGLYAHLDGCKYITADADQEWSHCRVPDGAIVLNKSGNVGAAAIVACAPYMYVNTVSDLINIRARRPGTDGPGRAIDSGYLVVFLNSPYGQSQLQRLSGGAVFDHVSLYAVPEIRIHEPNPLAQRYIGDKVRQAERLRERARCLEAAVASAHEQYIVPPTGIDFAKRTRRLAVRSLTERLDAHFYPSAVEQYFRQFSGVTRSLERLCSLVTNGQTQPESADGVRQATVTNLGRSFVEGSLRTVERPGDGSRAVAPHDLLLCNAAHNKSYIGRDITYSQVEGAYPSTEVMVVRVDRTQVPASFVRHYLKTEIGYLQIQSTIRGITAHSYPTDVRLIEIPIPTVPDTERPAWFATDDKMLEAGRCFDAARVLTSVAMAVVERLIAGRVTEADLVAAQKALEAGDRSADRDILKTLRRHDAPDARPLIPDLDVLYALLDESEENEA